MADSWHHILVRPFLQQWPIIALSCACSFLLQWASGWLLRTLFPATHAHLEKTQSVSEWCVRNVSTAHCLVAFTLIPRFFMLPDRLKDDFYSHDPWTQTVLSVSVGYFTWDIVICFYYRWGPAFVCHALCSWMAMYAGLYPFLHQQARFYLGFFEISTPLLNMYKQVQLCGGEGTALYAALGVLFAASFTTFRIIIGLPYAALWWRDMYFLWQTGKVHSKAILVMYLVNNLFFNGVNLVWWRGILALATRRLAKPDKP